MQPRSLAIVAVLIAAALAGCLSGAPSGGGTDADPPPGDDSNVTPWRMIRCDDGLHEGIVEGAVDLCNTRIFGGEWGPANELDIAVDPDDPRHLVAGGKDYTLGETAGCDQYNVWNGVYTSHDGGRNWSTQLMPGHPGDDQTTSLSTYRCNSDPVVDFLPDGTALFSGLPYDGQQPVDPTDERVFTGGAITMHRSEDRGDNWSDASYPATSEDEATLVDKQWFAVDRGTGDVWVTYMRFGAGIQLEIVRSIDGGRTWIGPEVLFEAPAPSALKQFATPVVGPDGTVYVSWLNFLDSTVYLSRNIPGTMAFTPGLPVRELDTVGGPPNTEHRGGTYPVLAADPTASGHLYMVWEGAGDGHSDIRMIRSTDGGLSWSDPVTVNDETENAQYMPWVDVGPDGQVHVVWYDRRDDPANVNNTVYYAHLDPGDWPEIDPNLRVGEVAFDGDVGYHQTGVPFIGDYINVDAADGIAHLIWADTRHGRSEAYHAAILAGPNATAAG